MPTIANIPEEEDHTFSVHEPEQSASYFSVIGNVIWSWMDLFLKWFSDVKLKKTKTKHKHKLPHKRAEFQHIHITADRAPAGVLINLGHGGLTS